MRRLYANEFHVQSATGSGLAAKVRDVCEAYMTKYVSEPKRSTRQDGESALWAIEGTFPDFGDHVSLRIARHGDQVGFAVELLSPDQKLLPTTWAPQHLSVV